MTIRQIENFPDYYVSTEGDIYSTKKSKTLIKLKPWIDSKGKYLQIGLINSEGKRIKMLIHRIVASAFIPNPNNLPEINHKDKNTQRNCVENLEWCTRKYNVYDSYNTLSPKRNNNKCTLYKNNKKIKDFENKPFHLQYKIKEPNIDIEKSKLYRLQNNGKEEIPVRWKEDVFWFADMNFVEDGTYDLVFEIWDLAGNKTVIKPKYFV